MSIEVRFLVYCSKCGFKNEDDAEVCSKCGVSLQTSRYEKRGARGRRVEDDCFGLPHGGAIVGLIIGIIIILWGLTQIVPGLLPENFELWWLIIIIIGVLIISGSLYRFSRR